MLKSGQDGSVSKKHLPLMPDDLSLIPETHADVEGENYLRAAPPPERWIEFWNNKVKLPEKAGYRSPCTQARHQGRKFKTSLGLHSELKASLSAALCETQSQRRKINPKISWADLLYSTAQVLPTANVREALCSGQDASSVLSLLQSSCLFRRAFHWSPQRMFICWNDNPH